MKKTIPCLAFVVFLFAFLQVAQGQSSPPEPKSLDKTGNAESLPELVRRVKPSVVSVLTYDAKGEPLISGTGFFIRPGEVVTNMFIAWRSKLCDSGSTERAESFAPNSR